ncbi:hypothetical protein Tco_0923057 [Tanacetum coccineum]|uniref:Uncharacterized protein n=1 Tax=Tanacetum coccineum TaxID=301880 RepID=A0ABQ5D366_9ASTR
MLLKMIQATALSQDKHLAEWVKPSTSMAWNLGPRMSAIENSQASIRTEVSSLKQDTSYIKSTMTEIYQAFKGQSSAPLSSVPQTTLAITEETEDIETQVTAEDKEEIEQEPREPTNAVPISSIRPPKTTSSKAQPITTNITLTKLVKASSIVREDPDEPIRVPYMINGKMYNLTNDAINAHLEKGDQIKKAAEEAKRITELDELGPIIQKKKNTIVKDLMISLGKRYERLKRIHEELGIQSALPTLIAEQEPEYEIFFTDVFSDQAFQRWNDIHKARIDTLVSYLVMVAMIKTPENERFSLKLKKMIAEHPNQEKLKSKRVKLEAVRYKLD